VAEKKPISTRKLTAVKRNLALGREAEAQRPPADREHDRRMAPVQRERYRQLAFRIYPHLTLDPTSFDRLRAGDLEPLLQLQTDSKHGLPADRHQLRAIARACLRLLDQQGEPAAEKRRKATAAAHAARSRYASLARAAKPHLTSPELAAIASGNLSPLKRLVGAGILTIEGDRDLAGAAKALRRFR
jgi:hypothetical protein